jgi:hypothetical protein
MRVSVCIDTAHEHGCDPRGAARAAPLVACDQTRWRCTGRRRFTVPDDFDEPLPDDLLDAFE